MGPSMPRGRRPHLLLFGWYRPGTGFTRVLEALVPYLAREFRITWLGVGYRGPAREWAPGVRLEPTNLEGGDMVGAYAARLRWCELRPDVLFALNDLWYLQHYSRELAPLLGATPMLGYLPLDGRLDQPARVCGLVGFDRLLTYTRTAANNLREMLALAGNPIPVECLGHGVDIDRFAPIGGASAMGIERRMARAQRYFGLAGPAFVVLNAARPDPRKRIDLTLEAFSRFARNRPANVRLCLHQAHAHPDQVRPLRELARGLGVERRIIWHPRRPGPVDDDGLNRLYNACAVGINTAAGEGFGLVSFEHAATGAPQVLPDQLALRELWGGSALRVPARPVRTRHSPLEMVEADVSRAAAALDRLYREPATYQRMASAARARAADPALRWQRVAAQLLAILREADSKLGAGSSA